MHFSLSMWVFVDFRGAKPTSLSFSCVDNDHSSHVGHPKGHLFSCPLEYRASELPISIAEATLHAQNKIRSTDRGKSLGAKNGMTVELAGAQSRKQVRLVIKNLLTI